MHAICMYLYVYIYIEYTHIDVLMLTLDFKTLAIFECRNRTVRIIQPRPFKSKVFPRTCLFRTVWRAVFQLDLNSLQSFNGGAKYLFSKSRSCIRLNVSMKGLTGLSLKPTAIGVNPFNWLRKSPKNKYSKHPNKKHELRVHSPKQIGALHPSIISSNRIWWIFGGIFRWEMEVKWVTRTWILSKHLLRHPLVKGCK